MITEKTTRPEGVVSKMMVSVPKSLYYEIETPDIFRHLHACCFQEASMTGLGRTFSFGLSFELQSVAFGGLSYCRALECEAGAR